MLFDQYLQEASLDDDAPSSGYPYDLPVVRALRGEPLRFHPRMTYLVGENGTGKSTLLEAVATVLGFNPEGGSRNLRFSTNDTHSDLDEHLHVSKGKRPRRGYFVRSESFYNLATAIDEIDPAIVDSYGGRSLHVLSHGESFLTLAQHQFGGLGLFLLDEPEAALSPARQLAILALIHQSILQGSQYVIATHSPILMAYPGAWIYSLSDTGLQRVDYDDTEHVRVTRAFLDDPDRMLRRLFE